MVVGVNVKNISKTFWNGSSPVTPLNGVSFSLEPGKLTTVLGKSGCGKTTLLKTIIGLEKIDSGSISFSYKEKDGVEKPNISLVFQEPRLLPWKTVKDNLELAIRNFDLVRREKSVSEVLELVQLPGVENLYPNQLSGGMAQRVGLARGIISKPDLLLLDEPFGALDFMTRSQLQIDFSRIQSELSMTMLLITHDINEAILLSDEVLFMKDGRIANSLKIPEKKPRNFGDANLVPYQQKLFNFFIK